MFFGNLGISDSVSTPVAGSYFWYDPGNTDSYPGTGSTLYDISGNGRNATVYGSPTHVSGLGGYFDFDGVNDYILSANAFNGGNNVHTLEVWIRTSALDECIWSDLGQTTPNASYHFSGCQINNISGIQDRIIVSVWNGSNPDDAVANAQGPAALDTWYQIVRVYDGARVKGYANGEFTSNSLPEPFDDPTTAWYFAFGHEDSTDILNLPAGMFSGRYGTIRFYNRALSAGEIRKNYDATRALYTDPTLVQDSLFMQLDASTYTSGTWNDLTPNANNATINGATWSSTDGGIFDLDGVNDTISIPHNSSLSLSTTVQKTIQVWVKFDALPGLNQQVPVFGKLSSSYAFDGYWGGLFSNTGTVRCTTNGSSIQRISTSTSTVTTNTWYLFTFISQITSTSNTTKVYINETEYITATHGTDGYSESNPLYLGYIGSGVSSLYLNGKIGACYFYTKGLSTTEITQNYNATKSRYGL